MSRPFAPKDLSERLLACSSAQEQVRVTMAAFGGYWRPLAAVARLLEELGELSDELVADGTTADGTGQPGSWLGTELADLWIITTALADQYLAEVTEPRHFATVTSGELQPATSTAALLSAAGQIARIINYYDGPKTPRGDSSWMSIGTAVARFHEALSEIAEALGVDLAAAVQAKLLEIPALDSGRFSATWHDPATAACLSELRRLPGVAGGPLATARLWGAPDWQPGSIAVNAEAVAPSLVGFAKAARAEHFDGYVIPGPPPSPEGTSNDSLRELVQELSAHDPQPSRRPDPAEQAPILIFDGLVLSASRHWAVGQGAGSGAFTCLHVEETRLAG